MQVDVINAGNLQSFDYLLYPNQHPNTNNYIVNQFNNISNALNDFGRQFIESSKEIYTKINDSNAARIAKAALRSVKGLFHQNTIMQLYNIDEIQNAQPIMQRYIMAEPTIRELYLKQRCDGYSDSYVNMMSIDIADSHYDYQKIMDGVIQEYTNENGEIDWESKHYYYSLMEGDVELSFQDRIDILNTWDVLKQCIASGNDPTDIFNGKLEN